ncbi:hypothetical protein FIBSPDRAFT_862631 [Athelia psychrophila]|uniref:Uncharacterized protein n=1 Tax=Athelia psychrophila TaxID=1759441 RepID=A0A166I2P8_9AGAM|nr:hypothetical protein FIBSPDRAFT_862631 [Fibularhizoctonia sp. CBS 109695]
MSDIMRTPGGLDFEEVRYYTGRGGHIRTQVRFGARTPSACTTRRCAAPLLLM